MAIQLSTISPSQKTYQLPQILVPYSTRQLRSMPGLTLVIVPPNLLFLWVKQWAAIIKDRDMNVIDAELFIGHGKFSEKQNKRAAKQPTCTLHTHFPPSRTIRDIRLSGWPHVSCINDLWRVDKSFHHEK